MRIHSNQPDTHVQTGEPPALTVTRNANSVYKTVGALALALLSIPSAQAASNAIPGTGAVMASETVDLGAGPFNHGAPSGSADNSIAFPTFVGGFTANSLTLSGTTNSVNPATYGSEADFVLLSPGAVGGTLGTTGPNATYTTFDYNITASLAGIFPAGINPVGAWSLEFFDSFDDGPGPDSSSTNVMLTFEEIDLDSDTNGVFALGSFGVGGSAMDIGEFATSGVFDSYTFTLTEPAIMNAFTAADLAGFVGADVDSEIALFDSSGVLVSTNDDIDFAGGNFFSGLTEILAAGDYMIAVGGYNTAFANGNSVTAGNATGDYTLNLSFTAVPEPSAVSLFALAFCGLILRRRRA